MKLERLEELAHQYQADCEAGKDEEKGWPSTSYAISKLFVNGVCRVFALVFSFQPEIHTFLGDKLKLTTMAF